ncbi:transglutaminase-like domain-containing protein [Lacrimispora sp. 210928-DFI.3.58]|uniref:transglutaminase-like domain-containing protein n=1 Tax=Lacrimispora sp. 210928-DFI.3.58 TaxID=2883214 RepID=UPI0015B5FAB0|nr:transglutaminase family protein [Lacrimispora sp. 210928-DFI.3.58]MCB7319554.1 transglutaminase family protein [Lacrimispora sp. 210928-DFI.3.58]
MKKLHFHYEMQLQLAGPAIDHYFRFRCLPYKEDVQQDMDTSFYVEPAGFLREITDGFGSRCLTGEALAPHEGLHVVSRGNVLVDHSKRKMAEADPVFRYPSHFTEPEENIRQLYENVMGEYVRSGDSGRGIFFVRRLMEAVYRHMSYVPGATDIHTTAAQALRGGKGVCQDYTHILLSMCRMAGIPARYAAGAMIGEGATHAWAEVWLEGMWLGADPTNCCMTDETYIKFSHGRDYGDCTVDRGCFRGAAGQQQRIYVKVEETTW